MLMFNYFAGPIDFNIPSWVVVLFVLGELIALLAIIIATSLVVTMVVKVFTKRASGGKNIFTEDGSTKSLLLHLIFAYSIVGTLLYQFFLPNLPYLFGGSIDPMLGTVLFGLTLFILPIIVGMWVFRYNRNRRKH